MYMLSGLFVLTFFLESLVSNCLRMKFVILLFEISSNSIRTLHTHDSYPYVGFKIFFDYLYHSWFYFLVIDSVCCFESL